MTDAQLEAILDACTDDLISGRRTVDECLAAWPDHRAELAPLLGAARNALPPEATRPNPALDPRRLDQLMATIAATPQQFSEPATGTGKARIARQAPAVSGHRPERASSRWLGAWVLNPFRSAMVPVAMAALLAVAVILTPSTSNVASAAMVTVFSGQLEASIDGSNWYAVVDGTSVSEGEYLRTRSGTVSVLTFPGGATVSTQDQAVLRLSRVRTGETPTSPAETSIEQSAGSAWYSVDRGRQEVRTPDLNIATSRGSFEVVVVDGGTELLVVGGEVEADAGGTTLSLHGGERLVVGPAAETMTRATRVYGVRVEVAGPFVASLIDAQGRATGVAGGMAFRQIPGVDVSSTADATTQFDLTAAPVEAYALVLRRQGPGAGSVTLSAGSSSRSIELADGADAWLPLAFDTGAEAISLTAWGPAYAGLPSGTLERVTVPGSEDPFETLDPAGGLVPASPAPGGGTVPVSPSALATAGATQLPLPTGTGEVPGAILPATEPLLDPLLSPIEGLPVDLDSLDLPTSELLDSVDETLEELLDLPSLLP